MSHIEARVLLQASDTRENATVGSPVFLAGALLEKSFRLSAIIGVLGLVLGVFSAYAYLLKWASAYLPAFLSIPAVVALFVLARLTQPIQQTVAEQLVLVYPRAFRDEFLSVLPSATTAASWLMGLFGVCWFCLQAYVVLRVGFGLYREGWSFRQSGFYRLWAD